MKKIFSAVAICVILLIAMYTFAFYLQKNKQEKNKKLLQTETLIENIVTVFYHEPQVVSFEIKDAKGISRFTAKYDYVWGEDGHRSYDRLTAKRDVPEDKIQWARIFYTANSDGLATERLELHLHSKNGIQGAGWNHGKFGSGQTEVLK